MYKCIYYYPKACDERYIELPNDRWICINHAIIHALQKKLLPPEEIAIIKKALEEMDE
jgi:hypothetical protein